MVWLHQPQPITALPKAVVQTAALQVAPLGCDDHCAGRGVAVSFGGKLAAGQHRHHQLTYALTCVKISSSEVLCIA